MISNNNQIVNIERHIDGAVNGDMNSIEYIISNIKDMIYNLSIRFLFSKEDAEDATQEILIRIITHLDRFKGNSSFKTWVYSISKNYLISAKKKKAENVCISFEMMANDLHSVQDIEAEYFDEVALADLKIGCTQAMLLCLDREKRLMFILAKMFNISSKEGASIFELSEETYRKRLSRITSKMKSFLSKNCGLVNDNAKCRCRNRIAYAMNKKRINPLKPYFVERDMTDEQIKAIVRKMDKLEEESTLFLTNPSYQYQHEKLLAIIDTIQNSIH